MQSPVQWIWEFFPSGGVGVRSKAVDASSSLSPSSAEVKEQVVLYFYSLYPHTVDRDNCTTTYVSMNFFKWILSKHWALANGIISTLTRLCTGKPSNFGLISDQNIQAGSGANPAAYSMAKA